MPEPSRTQSSQEQLNELDLSSIDPDLLQPLPKTSSTTTLPTTFLLFIGLVATIGVSIEPSQRWLTLQVGSVGSVVLPLGLGIFTASLIWRILERQAKSRSGPRGPSFGERLQRFTKLEPWLAVLGLGGALILKVTDAARGFETGIGILAVFGGLFGALWLSRQIERRVDP